MQGSKGGIKQATKQVTDFNCGIYFFYRFTE
jgi:hypothetical protein